MIHSVSESLGRFTTLEHSTSRTIRARARDDDGERIRPDGRHLSYNLLGAAKKEQVSPL